ncbi:MAG: NADH-quinone oxidoreductase subunit A [Bryobacteraceae bacterium]
MPSSHSRSVLPAAGASCWKKRNRCRSGWPLVPHSGNRVKDKIKDTPYESGMTPVGNARERISVRFYLVAMLFNFVPTLKPMFSTRG